MVLGTHYIALNVKDLKISKAFYEKLGFTVDDKWGGIDNKWIIMVNGPVKIGLYQEMFPKNILVFNPEDARSIHQQLIVENTEIAAANHIDEPNGPCHFSIVDPDGNVLLFDQEETLKD